MKKTIYLSLIIIIISSSILIYKINKTPKYDTKIYNEIYSQYEEIINEQNISNVNTVSNTQKVYITNSMNNTYRVIATIQIPKLNISYPIINEYNEEYLKIAPTKLMGPEPNTVGNFVITRS